MSLPEHASMKHRYQRLLIRASLLYLLSGILVGLYLYAAKAFAFPVPYVRLRSLHVHLILLGGVVQLIMGVALWMFPRHKRAPHYTPAWQGMLLFVLFNLGSLIRFFCEFFFNVFGDGIFVQKAAFFGAALQVLSLAFFFYLIYGRIRKP